MNHFIFVPPRPTQSSPKRSNRAPPHTPCRSNLLSFPSFIAPACFLLIVVCDLFVGGRLPRYILFLTFFSSFHSPPGMMRQRPPTRSTPVASPLQRTTHHRHQLLVNCCVFRLNGGNLRPRHPPSLNFNFFYPNSSPQTTGKHPPYTFRPRCV
jgi:hypothetical protein